jgi:hypothetical protein
MFKHPVYQTFGSIWYDVESERRCSLKLEAFRLGLFFAKPLGAIDNPPYLKGDIVLPSSDPDGVEDRNIKIGFIYTESNQYGCIYNGVLELDPWPTMIPRWIASGNAPSALFLNVILEDE